MDTAAVKEAYQEAIAAGETAFSATDYETALTYFRKALEAAPDDVYALSRAGAAAVTQNLYDEAKSYFQRALDIQPENGDNAFNMGSAEDHAILLGALGCFVEP